LKDQYVGDISDYFKYAFLRRAQNAGAKLVISWMLTAPDGKSDGAKRDYLSNPEKFRPVDPEAFDALTAIESAGHHSIAAVEASGILRGVPCQNDIFPDDNEDRAQLMWRLEESTLSFQQATVFFDPDNGLEISSKKPGRKDSSKFLFVNEFAQMARAGRSVIVYQHLGQRHMPRSEFLTSQLDRLAAIRGAYEHFALVSPLAAALCAEPLDGARPLRDAAEDLVAAWPDKKTQILSRV